MTDDRERRATGAESQSGSMPRQREAPRTERLEATSASSSWRPRQMRATGAGSPGMNTIRQTLPRWLQQRGMLFVIPIIVLITIIAFLTIAALRGDRREATLGAPEPTALVQPTAGSGLVPGTEDTVATPEPTPVPTPRVFVVVNTGGQGLFLRPQPNRNNDPLATLPDGTRLVQIGDDVPGGDYVWRPVRTPDGLEGYVAVDFLAPAE